MAWHESQSNEYRHVADQLYSSVDIGLTSFNSLDANITEIWFVT